MADGDRAPTPRGQDTLINEIEQTRENLARTIDAIADRVSPANNVRRVKDRARQRAAELQKLAGERAAELQKRLGDIDPRLRDPRVLAAGALLAAGAVAFLVWRRRR